MSPCNGQRVQIPTVEELTSVLLTAISAMSLYRFYEQHINHPIDGISQQINLRGETKSEHNENIVGMYQRTEPIGRGSPDDGDGIVDQMFSSYTMSV